MLLVLFAVTGADPILQVFTWASGVATVSVLVLLVLTSVAVLAFFHRERLDTRTWHTRVAPALGTVALVAVLALVLTNFTTLISGSAGLATVLLALVAVVFAGGFVLAGVQGRTPSAGGTAMSTAVVTPEQQAFRGAMAHLSAAVNVVTTGRAGGPGRDHRQRGLLGDRQPAHRAGLRQPVQLHARHLRRNGRICVNVLGAEHEELAMHFAGATKIPMEERFGWQIWDHDTAEVPILRDALVPWSAGSPGTTVRGSHSVLFVAVERTVVRDDTAGLVYFQRQFHRLGGPTATTA